MKLIFLVIFRPLRHRDVTTILYWTYEFRFEIRVSNLVSMLNLTHNIEYRLGYCNVTPKKRVTF